MDELDRVLELSEKVYRSTATPEEKEELFRLLKELIGSVKVDLDAAKKE